MRKVTEYPWRSQSQGGSPHARGASPRQARLSCRDHPRPAPRYDPMHGMVAHDRLETAQCAKNMAPSHIIARTMVEPRRITCAAVQPCDGKHTMSDQWRLSFRMMKRTHPHFPQRGVRTRLLRPSQHQSFLQKRHPYLEAFAVPPWSSAVRGMMPKAKGTWPPHLRRSQTVRCQALTLQVIPGRATPLGHWS